MVKAAVRRFEAFLFFYCTYKKRAPVFERSQKTYSFLFFMIALWMYFITPNGRLLLR